MALAELRGGICPTCHKRFPHAELCPEDGTPLQPLGVVPTPLPSAALPRTEPSVAGGRRPPPPRAWWFVLGGLLITLAITGVVMMQRGLAPVFEARSQLPPAAGSAATVSAPLSAAVATLPTAPAAEGTVQGVTDTEVVLGMAAPMTGPARELGRQMKLGVESAFGVINQAGGIHGRALRLVAVDDGYEPSRTGDAMKELDQKDRVLGLIGNVGTPTAMVALPYALERKMLFFGAFTGADLLRREPPDRYVFNVRASYSEETAAVVSYLVNVRRFSIDQIAVFAQEDAFGDSGFAGVSRAVRALGGDPAATLRLGYKRNTIDVSEAVERLRAHPTPIRAVVMVGTYRASAKFIEKARDLFPKMVFSNVSFAGSTALADELNLLGPRYATGVIVTQVVPPVESYSSFILAYKEALAKYAPGESPDYVSLEGYLNGLVLAEGLQRAGRELNTERLVTALESITELDVGMGTPIRFGKSEHQGSHKVWGTRIAESGKYEILDLE